MQLTNRQCWDVIRSLVKEKNDEYSKFLGLTCDSEQKRKLLGYTRDSFLSKMGFYSMEDLNSYIKGNGKAPVQNWLDNLSCEDLLIFLDFRCQSLQEMYDYRVNYGTINRSDIKYIIEKTPISKLILFNNGKLTCAGKPKRKGEQNVFEMGAASSELNERALAQVMSSIACQYSEARDVSIERAIEEVVKLKTYNINVKGLQTGYKYRGMITIESQLPEEFRMEEDDILALAKFVGIDIQGAPVYEYCGKYYNSIGIMLSDDVMIFNNENDDLIY